MPLTLPPGKRMAVALTFDFDAHSSWMGSPGWTSLSYLSRGDFGAEEGVPRILATLGERQLPATRAVPGHDLVIFPALADGEERRLLELSLRQHEQVTGTR